MFQKMNSPTYWQLENTTQSPGVITYPQFVTFDMTKVFMVQNILAIFRENVLLMGRNIVGWVTVG